MYLSARRVLSNPIFRACLGALLFSAAAQAQDDRDPGWYDTAELSFVGTDGNSEATTLGFTNKLERFWENAQLTFTANALRPKTTTFTRFATGTVDDFQIVEESDEELTAERYGLGLRYDREISEAFFWYTGVRWKRDQFAGFDSRIVASGGVGNTWWEDDDGHFRTDYGVTYTSQDDIVEDPSVEDSFLGLQAGWELRREFGNATYSNLFVVDVNLDETEDLRGDMEQSLAVSMTARLALKVSLQWLYDNLPALASVRLVDEQGVPTGETVPRQLEELDQVLTVALVVNF